VPEKIVFVALLTEREAESLRIHADRLWPVDETPCFGSLLASIDDADRALWRERDAFASGTPDAPHLIFQKL
jgi:hypothetical protein